MKKIKAIVVDDEESARDVLDNLLRRFCPDVEVLDKCNTVEQAVESIRKNKPELVFLDIEMPNFAGYEIVNFFDQIDFEIIFVTAYDKYAIRAFEISAVDYLLKPIDIDRLKSAVCKASLSIDMKLSNDRLSLLATTLQSNELHNIVVSDKGFQHIIPIKDIIAFEAQESYCTIHTVDKKFTASKNLKHFERIFIDTRQFFRVHKSWIINKDFIVNYSKSELTINLENSICAKLSKYKKVEFEESIVS